MGLTIHYTIRAAARVRTAEVLPLVKRMQAAARAMLKTGRVTAMGRIGSGPEDFFMLSEWLTVPVPGEENTSRGIEVPVLDGYVFDVTLGEGCEPLRLGLCRYPTHVVDAQTGRRRAVAKRGWRLAGFCKTQYASLQGWENFRRCHLAAVDLLAGLAELGLKVAINDEGNYWPGRDEAALRAMVDRMNGMVAALAGQMKDAADEEGGAPVKSPIFAHPQFERLEAEGAAANADQLRAVAAVVKGEKRQRGGKSDGR